MTGNWDYLSCIAGMMDGITSSDLHKSKSLNPEKYRIAIGEGPQKYLDWYDRQKPDLAAMLF
jgi:hypothetical protein